MTPPGKVLGGYVDLEAVLLSICPTCKEPFETIRGMSIHHTAKHPEAWEDRFWKFVPPATGDECWEWRGALHRHGYGVFNVNQEAKLAHRVSYTTEIGEPDNSVLHHCDNPPCVNPDHLYDGTRQDNVDDMWDRGRANPQYGPGEQSNASVLSQEEVVEIKGMIDSGAPRGEIAEKFSVSKSAIGHIDRGETWGDV